MENAVIDQLAVVTHYERYFLKIKNTSSPIEGTAKLRLRQQPALENKHIILRKNTFFGYF